MCVCVGRKFFTTKIKLREKKRGEQQQLTRGVLTRLQTADCRPHTKHKTQNTWPQNRRRITQSTAQQSKANKNNNKHFLVISLNKEKEEGREKDEETEKIFITLIIIHTHTYSHTHTHSLSFDGLLIFLQPTRQQIYNS